MNCRNYKFRLYPTTLQQEQLVEALDGCRWVYNYFIEKLMSKEDMQFALTELKEQETFLRNYHSKMLQMVCHKVDTANKSLAALRKNGHKIGKLHYVRSDDYKSFTYNQSGFDITIDGMLWLSKIGKLRIKLHRKVENIKQVTIRREGKKWYAVICCEVVEPIFKFVDTAKSIGIDVGITKFCHDSDNPDIKNPQFLKKLIRPLGRASRRLSRRQKGSHNRMKAKSRLQILHERIRNKRFDFLHKQSKYYSERYDLIFLEKLRVLNMTKNHSLARAILDSGWATFGKMLEYKAKKVIGVLAADTTIDCSKCGNAVRKSLAVRMHGCDKCGVVLDRDYNAALNILHRGFLSLDLPVERRESTPEETERSLNQEMRLLVYDW